MQLSLRPAQPHLFHPGAVNAIAAWRGTAGHGPLRLLRGDRVGPGRRARFLLAAGALAAGILGSAGLAAALLPAGPPVGPARDGVEASDATAAGHEVSGAEVALALQAAGAFSGPLPGRDRPALRFGVSPELPLPEIVPPEPPVGGPRAEPGEAPATAAVETRAASPGAAEPAAAATDEPVQASLPRRAPVSSAPPRTASAPTARHRHVALAARRVESPPRAPSGPAPSWTLPGALAPTTP